jgi:hypothetical protein
VYRSVRFCVSPDKHHRPSCPLPYDRRATVDKNAMQGFRIAGTRA